MATYVSAGFTDMEQFWYMTPREITMFLRGAVRRLEREHDERAWLAWHIAKLPGSKTKFKDLLSKKTTQKMIPKSAEELWSIAQMWIGTSRGR